MSDNTNLTMLCKVVDNFGDIGFVYRLAKNLLKVNANYKIRIVTDNLNAFKKLAPPLDENLSQQEFLGMNIFDWNACDICRKEFIANPPKIILECFQCGRPEWLDEILFAENCDNPKRLSQTFQIINIDYLTAEPYAEEFHCLKSGTRSARVKKVNFMPGFTAKTGGLILDEPFSSFNAENLSQQPKRIEAGEFPQPQIAAAGLSQNNAACKKILIFSYPKNFTPIINAIKKYGNSQIFLAQGIGKDSFLKAAAPMPVNVAESSLGIENTKAALAINELPFLPQDDWDKTMLAMDILFIRGEDSLARACLCGKPFVWNAYIQDEDYHLVKVAALLERMKEHFAPDEFAVIEKFWLLYNGKDKEKNNYAQMLEDACFEFLRYSERLARGFLSFSKSLFAIGNFSEKLNEFICSFEN